MNQHFRLQKLGAIIVAASTLLIPASPLPAFSAGQSPYDQAVNSYLKEDYKDALERFKSLAKTEANNEKVHYYLALCHQQLDDDKAAVQEYEWVLSHSKDKAFKEIIEERLLRTKRRLGLAKASKEEEKPAQLAKHEPVKKVIWFSTNWCSHCKKFAGSWEAGKKKFSKTIDFEHYNAEAPSDFKMVQKYKPKAYPTLVYLDGQNKVLENFADAPEADKFIQHLKELGAKEN